MKIRVARTAIALATTAGLAVSMGLAQSPAGAASGPDIQWDYSMPDNFGPVVDGVVGPPGNEQDLTGMFVPENPMSADPDYAAAGNALYGSVPSDGKYSVTLDACATKVSGDATYSWMIDGNFTETPNCRDTQQLTEGTKAYTLRVTDSTGTSQVTGTFVVKDVLMVVMGDSYASGEGYPPFVKDNVNPANGQPYTVDSNTIPTPKYIPDWDETTCQRTRWSGFVRAASQLEKVDTHSSVTLIDVACAGAQVSGNDNIYKPLFGGGFGGILTAKQPLNAVGNWPNGAQTPFSIPPQIDQINALRKGQQIDVNLLSIGGNDIGFGPIVTQCLLLADYNKSCYTEVDPGAGDLSVLVNSSGRALWQGVDDASNALTDKYAKLAECLGTGDCQTMKEVGGFNNYSPTQPLGITAANTVQAVYPNLVNDSNGQFCNRSINSMVFPNGQSRAEWDTSMLSPIKHSDADYITNVAIAGQGGAKNITLWQGNTSTLMNRFVPLETQQYNIVTPTAPSFLQHMMRNAGTFGWTISFDPYLKSTNGGLCADDSTRVVYQVLTDKTKDTNWGIGINMSPKNLPVVGDTLNRGGAVHPNNVGQQNYADSLFPRAKTQAGLPVPEKTQQNVNPTPPPPLDPPTNVKAKTKSCGKKYCKVLITFKEPADGLTPDGYKIKTKVKGHSWDTLRQGLQKTKTTWSKAPWKKKQFTMKIGAYAMETLADGSKVQYISWSKVKTYKIKR